jgi:hypothetical protein
VAHGAKCSVGFFFVDGGSSETFARRQEWYAWFGRLLSMTFDKIERLLVRSVLMIGMLMELVKLAMFELSKR